MPFDYKDIIVDGYQENDADRAAAMAELESARKNDDAYGVREARKRLQQLDGERRSLDNYANQLVQSQRPAGPPPGFENHRREDQELAAAYRLTPERYDHATCWTSDPRVPKKERIETFLRNEQRLQALRAGGYRDEVDAQGRR